MLLRRPPPDVRMLAVLQLTLAALAAGLATPPAGAYTIEPGHPRLYFTAADLATLRARTATTHAAQWQTLRSGPQPGAAAHATYSGRDATHHCVERNAFLSLMRAVDDPVAAAADARTAHAWLMALATHDFAGHPNDVFEFIWTLAIGYDWLHTWPGFSEADKQVVRATLVARAHRQVDETGLNGFRDWPTGPATSKSRYRAGVRGVSAATATDRANGSPGGAHPGPFFAPFGNCWVWAPRHRTARGTATV